MAQVDMTTIGNSGNTQSFYRMWLPDEGRNAAEFYQEMRDRDAIIGGVFLAIESLFKGVNWSVTPADDSEAARQWANFLEECRADMSHTWAGFMGIVTAGVLVNGWAYFEKVYKIRLGPDQTDATRRSRFSDGRIGWRKFGKRPQASLNRWEFDGDGGVQGMWQNTPGGPVLLPIQKCLHFTSNEDGPEGRSMLMNARQSYKYQERLAQFEAMGIERDLAGMPYVQVPPELLEVMPDDNSDEAQAKRATLRALEKMAGEVRNDERAFVMMPAAIIPYSQMDKDGNQTVTEGPSGYKFELLTSGGTRAHDTDKIIKRYSQRISSSVLATFLLLGGSEGKGAQALSGDLTDLFLTVCTGLLDSMAQVVQRFAVADLMRLNGVPPELWPVLGHNGLKDADIHSMLKMLVELTGGQVITPDDALEDHVRDLLGLPERAAVEGEAPRAERQAARNPTAQKQRQQTPAQASAEATAKR